VGEYDVGDSGARFSERLLTRQELLKSTGDATIVTPDRNIAEAAKSRGLPVEEVEPPQSDAIARLGWTKIQTGQTVSPEDLEANYIRRADAEIMAGRKL